MYVPMYLYTHTQRIKVYVTLTPINRYLSIVETCRLVSADQINICTSICVYICIYTHI